MRFLLTALLVLPSLALGQQLHTLTNGEVADAEKINENFLYVLESALGGCQAEQDGSNVLIACADGSSGMLASAGTVVTFLDGQIGEQPYTFNSGSIVVVDGNDNQLGLYLDGNYQATYKQLTLRIQEEPNVNLVMSEDYDRQTIVFPYNTTLFYETSDCTGAAFRSEPAGEGFYGSTKGNFMSTAVRLLTPRLSIHMTMEAPAGRKIKP